MITHSVVQLPDKVIEAKPIPYQSAQAAELISLTIACRLFAGGKMYIYTDSNYAFGVVHDFGVIWQRRGYVAADGTTISHSSLVSDLLKAIHLPAQILVIYCRAHTSRTDTIS